MLNYQRVIRQFHRFPNGKTQNPPLHSTTSKVQERGVQVQHLFQDAVQAIIGRLPAVITNAGIHGFVGGKMGKVRYIYRILLIMCLQTMDFHGFSSFKTWKTDGFPGTMIHATCS